MSQKIPPYDYQPPLLPINVCTRLYPVGQPISDEGLRLQRLDVARLARRLYWRWMRGCERYDLVAYSPMVRAWPQYEDARVLFSITCEYLSECERVQREAHRAPPAFKGRGPVVILQHYREADRWAFVATRPPMEIGPAYARLIVVSDSNLHDTIPF